MPFNKSQYDQEYNRKHITRKFIPFNNTVSEDVEILSWLSTKDNVTQYIKGLIRADIGRKNADSMSNRLSEKDNTLCDR